MTNTYTQLLMHYVFVVQNRLCLIKENFKNDIEFDERYIFKPVE